jgi:signal peptidase I
VLVGVLLVTRASLADHYRVPSGSMLPSVHVGDRIVVDKRAYGLRVPLTKLRLTEARMPARGDVVVLESPESGIVLLKRVVAVANDTVSVRDGHVWIDGEPLPTDDARGLEWFGEQPHRVAWGSGGPNFGPHIIPPGELLVMGDNPGNSHDGRSFGFVKIEAILGRAAAVVVRDGSVQWIDL